MRARARVGGDGRRALAAALLCLLPTAAGAQDLEPRAYSASPIGTTFLVVALGGSRGAVVFDPTLPITDVEANVGIVTVGAGRTFSLGGRLALLTAALPFAWGEMQGSVAEEARRITREGFADARVKFSVNLLGNPALPAREFVKAPPRRVVGVSVTTIVPTGEYDRQKLVNLGANRWGVKPEIGISQPAGRWDFDGYVGVTVFTVNDRFYPGERTREQDPVLAVQGHASYRFGRRAWGAVNYTYYRGGATIVDGGEPTSPQANTRVGATLSLPIGTRQSIKVAVSTGAATRAGADFDTLVVGWQRVWF